MKKHEFWFVVGSQFLYGPDVLDIVAARAAEMAAAINADPAVPCSFLCKGIVKTPEEAVAVVKDANRSEACAGVVTWTHTFSPSKMWIQAFDLLQKPLCHFATQYHEAIPESIDMDFMNLNQAAHGDREHGFILARLRKPQKIIMGNWRAPEIRAEIGRWMRAAVGFAAGRDLRIVRFGDNMRNVAVTEGDKIEAQLRLGWQCNTWPVGELAAAVAAVPEADVTRRCREYAQQYEIATDDEASVRYQARLELAIRATLERERAAAFTNTFEDLCGLEQLPGLATQCLLRDGYGFGAEGDWKLAALGHVIKTMTAGMPGGTSFMEDYTYHFGADGKYIYVEDYVTGTDAGFPGKETVSPSADFCLSLEIRCLSLFIECHHYHGCTEGMDFPCLAEKLLFPFFQAYRVDNGLALSILQACENCLPMR